MIGSRRLMLAVLGGLFTLATPTSVWAQSNSPYTKPGIFPSSTNPNGPPGTAPGQMSANIATLGRGLSQIPPSAAGYNTYIHSPQYGAGPGVYGGFGGYPWGGWGMRSPGMSYGYALQGVASVTQAQGQYWQDIQKASLMREQTRQTAIDTQRKRVEYELWYEGVRPTAPKMRDAERATDLDWARKDPPNSEIWSGRTLNTLLKSILASPAPTRGPTLSLEAETIKGLNLTDKTTRGNLSLAKDEGKIDWTESLQEAAFDDMRDSFTKHFQAALKSANEGKSPTRTELGELRSDLKRMDEKLDDLVRDLPPSRYIESRRLLNQLKDTVKGLSNPRVVKNASNEWKKNVSTVGDLVNHCLKHGLEFGPAVASGDEAAYTAAYYAIRSYERGVTQMSTASSSLSTP